MLQKFDGKSLDEIGAEVAAQAARALEQGQVLLFPELAFPLERRECRTGRKDIALWSIILLCAAVRQYDNHGHSISVCQQIIEQQAGFREPIPLRLVAADAV